MQVYTNIIYIISLSWRSVPKISFCFAHGNIMFNHDVCRRESTVRKGSSALELAVWAYKKMCVLRGSEVCFYFFGFAILLQKSGNPRWDWVGGVGDTGLTTTSLILRCHRMFHQLGKEQGKLCKEQMCKELGELCKWRAWMWQRTLTPPPTGHPTAWPG